ncbi:MAG: PD-(D/E)XK nuclease family protein [Acidobacteriota bacterium]
MSWLDEELDSSISIRQPIRIVVPSGALRRHLGRRLVEHRGGAVVGVSIQTLFGVALEVLERALEPAPGGGVILGLLVERFARERPALRRSLDDLQDGYASLAGTVRDLLDAGLSAQSRDAAVEALTAVSFADGGEGRSTGGAGREARRRAVELVQVAGDCARALELMELGRTSSLLRRAAELLDQEALPEQFLDSPQGPVDELSAGGSRLLPARALWVHGFADLTGVAADLLEVLLRRPDARLLVDQPPDPAERGVLESSFTERLLLRLGGSSALVATTGEALPAPQRTTVSAPGVAAECRAVARRLRSLLGEESAPRAEDVLVVARDLGPYRLPLAQHLERWAVPFSMPGAPGAASAATRAAEAFGNLLMRGGEASTESWLELLNGLPPWGELSHRRAELRLACHGLGAGRLRQVADLQPEAWLAEGRDALPLPLAAAVEEGEEEAAPRSSRRWLPGSMLRALVSAAGDLHRRLESWPDEAPLTDHRRRIDELLTQCLGARPESPLTPMNSLSAVRRTLLQGLDELPRELSLSRSEVFRLIRDLLGGVGRRSLGGQGGGVQILSAMEARGLTADWLFLVGMNRDLFPRVVREDPLLPDSLRRELAAVLPDIPVKRRGFDEERYLFAQLMDSAPRVELSWQREGDDGEARAPSPLLERLRWGSEGLPKPRQAVEWGAEGAPARDLALRAALQSGREAFLTALPAALAEEGRNLMPRSEPFGHALPEPRLPQRWAGALEAVLQEMDPDLSTAEGRRLRYAAGPYLGFLGVSAPLGSKMQELWITRLEHLAGCPWQLFATRLLKVEPPADPLAQLPELTPLVVGQVVHRVLETVAADQQVPRRGEVEEQLLESPGVVVRWPPPAALEALLLRSAREVLKEEGLMLPALARPLVERARPFLASAGFASPGAEQAPGELPDGISDRALDEVSGEVTVLGVEIEGKLHWRLGEESWGVRFRADRLDRDPVAGLQLVDYKTGKLRDAFGSGAVAEEAKQAKTRRQRFLRQIASGQRLQGAAYALALEALAKEPGAGLYLLLRPDLDPGLENFGARRFEAASGDEALKEAFQHALHTALQAWNRGVLPPRLEDPWGNEPRRCQYCVVAEACRRRDSGFRRRLVDYADRLQGAEGSGSSLAAEEAALLGLWRLPTGEGGSPR